MADSKVSNLPIATTVNSSDAFYIVQGSSKQITASKLFENVINATLRGNVAYSSNIDLLSTPGQAVDLSRTVTHLTVGASGGNISIPQGKESQLKIIVMISNSGGTLTLTGNIVNNGNVIFNNVGDTATLLYTNNRWFITGGTATIT